MQQTFIIKQDKISLILLVLVSLVSFVIILDN